MCPLESSRNLLGRYGLSLRHVVDYGPLYHLLEPRPLSTWITEGRHIDITATNSQGSVKLVRLIKFVKMALFYAGERIPVTVLNLASESNK